MKILVACEESQAVTIELRRLGHEAYSCDIIPCSGGHPEWHIMQNVLPLLNGNCSFKTMDGTEHSIETRWDMIIAFPPCTHLAVSGAKWFAAKRTAGSRRQLISSCNLQMLTVQKLQLKIRSELCLHTIESQTRLFSRGSLGMEKPRELVCG